MNNEKGHLDKSIIDIRKNVGKVVIETNEDIDIDAEMEDMVKKELEALTDYQQRRYRKIEKTLKNFMTDQTTKLKQLWKEERSQLDYTALKEIRFEFDQADKQVRNIISDWDRRKYSDPLADHLFDMHDQLFQVYFQTYIKMADEKRQEAVDQRRKEKELQEYKNEKRRPIPTLFTLNLSLIC